MDIIWTFVGHLLDIVWTSLGHHLDIIWISFGHHLDIIWTSFGDHLQIIQGLFRSHSGIKLGEIKGGGVQGGEAPRERGMSLDERLVFFEQSLDHFSCHYV